MTALIVIFGVLLIIAGVALMATPLMTFMSAGYFIIILFFLWGIYGLVRGIREKRYGVEFFFAILSLILGIVGLVMPNAAAMTNDYILLYLAAGWFIVHGILSIVTAIQSKKEDADTSTVVLCVVLGVLELIIGIYSFVHPAMMAVALGILIGIYFIEAGINVIVIGREVDD
jgi:uncharacterized membrane protein HdeD (DUF308 family)